LLVLFLALPLAYFLAALSSSQLSLIGQPITLQALGVSLLTATLATALLALLGVPLGYLLARRDFPGKAILNVLVFLPLILPPAASGIVLLLFFGPYQGLGSYWTLPACRSSTTWPASCWPRCSSRRRSSSSRRAPPLRRCPRYTKRSPAPWARARLSPSGE